MTMEITVRDGRAGHKVDSEGKGVVLGRFDQGSPLDEGDVIALADGTKVVVIGSEETINTQTVYVGRLPV